MSLDDRAQMLCCFCFMGFRKFKLQWLVDGLYSIFYILYSILYTLHSILNIYTLHILLVIIFVIIAITAIVLLLLLLPSSVFFSAGHPRQ